MVMCAALSACGRVRFDPLGDALDAPFGPILDADSVAVTVAQEALLTAANSESGDQFGWAIGLSADGTTLAVGAKGEQSNATGVNPPDTDNSLSEAGAAYVFVRTQDTWVQQAYLKASNTEDDDWFGASLALSGDGSTLAVAAIREDSSSRMIDGNQADNNAMSSGAVYVFERSGDTWTQRAYLKTSNADPSDTLGASMAMSLDGGTIVVGAFEDSDGTSPANNSFNQAGAAYVFVRSGATWMEQGYLKAAMPDAGDDLGGGGAKVDISADGNTVVVGANGEDSNATSVNGDQNDETALDSGAAYVFVRNGTMWSQEAYLKASNAEDLDRFGNCVAVSGDGATVAVGAGGEASGTSDPGDNSRARAGAIYLFARSGATWSQVQYIKASNPDMSDSLCGAALSYDGSILLGCAPDESSAASGIDGDQTDNTIRSTGACYVFERDGGGVWTQRHYIKASNPSIDDRFGLGGGDAVALSADGTTIAIGTAAEDGQGDNDTDAGAVYVFR
jgi:hypothetical protein